MDNKELLNVLKEARELIADRVPVFLAWKAIKALDEAIRQMDEKKAEVA